MSDETNPAEDAPVEGHGGFSVRRWLRRWRWALVGFAAVLAFVAVAYGLVPLAIRYVATDELEAMGAREVAIGSVEFEPFGGVATFIDLAVSGRDGDRLTADLLTVRLDFGGLFARRIHLSEIALEGALLDVRQLATGGILFAGLAPQSGPAGPEQDGGWLFGLDKLDIARSRLRYVEPDFETTLVLDDLSFGPVLAWLPEEVSDFQFSGTLGSSKLSAEGTAMPFAPVDRGDIQIDLSALDLSAFKTVFRDAGLPPLDGMVEARIALATTLAATAPPKIAIEGRIRATGASLGLESGALSGDRVVWSGRIAYDGALDAFLDLSGSLDAEGLRVSGDDPVSVGALTWDGRIALSEPGDDSTGLKLDGTARLDRVAVGEGGARKLSAGSIHVRDLSATLTLGSAGSLALDQAGRIEATDVAAEEGGRTVELDSLSWHGKAASSADGANLSVRGVGKAGSLVLRSKAAGETVRVETVELVKTVLDVKHGAGGLDIVHAGPIVVTGMRMETPEAKAQESRVAWTGRIAARLAEGGRIEGDLDGALRTEDMVIGLVAPALTLQYDSLIVEGKTTVAVAADGAVTSRTTGRTAMEKMALTDEDRALTIVSVARIALEGVQGTERGLAHADSLDVSDIWVGVPVLGENEVSPYSHEPMHIGRIRVDEVRRFDAEAMRLGKVAVTEFSLTAVRDENGEIQLPIVLTVGAEPAKASAPSAAIPADGASDPASAPSAGEAASETTQTMAVAIESLTIGKESHFSFVDLGVDPSFQETYKDLTLTLDGLDSERPESPARLTVSGALGDFSRVDVRGTFSPFADPASSDLRIELDAVDLPPLSAYSKRYLGYRLNTGQLDATIDMKISGTNLDATADLDIRQLTLDLEGDEELRALRKELGIPIETGLGLLRDSKGDIALSVPVTGEIGNPQFDFSDAINQAVGAAMKSAVLTILFPLGAVIAATENSGPADIRLAPVPFHPGTKEIVGEGRALLSKAAELLAGRAGITMRVCGFAVPADEAALIAEAKAKTDPEAEPAPDKPAEDSAAAGGTTAAAPPLLPHNALSNLAAERAIEIKSMLVDDYGIEAKRLLLCRPDVQSEAAEPRVEILL